MVLIRLTTSQSSAEPAQWLNLSGGFPVDMKYSRNQNFPKLSLLIMQVQVYRKQKVQ